MKYKFRNYLVSLSKGKKWQKKIKIWLWGDRSLCGVVVEQLFRILRTTNPEIATILPPSYFFFSEQTRNCYFKWALSKISLWSWLIKLHKIHNMQNHIRTLEHSREWQKFHTFLSVGNIKNYFLRMCWNFISWSLCRLKMSGAHIRTEKFDRIIKLHSSLSNGNIKTYFLRMCWNLISRSL